MTDVAQIRREAFLAWMDANGLNSNLVSKQSGVPYNTVHSYVTGATASLKGDAEARIARGYDLPVEAIFGFGVMMGEAFEPNHLRAWREYRRLSVLAVAAELKSTPAAIEQLESGEIGVSAKWYRRLAIVYGTTPGHLLDVDPSQVDADLLDFAAQRSRADQRRAARMLQAAFAEDTGTDG